MTNKIFVLDTSALMTFIEQEDGAERVREIILHQQILIPWLAVLEVVYISHRELGESEAMTRYAMLKRLNGKIIWDADESVLLTAARLKANHRLSFADSVIASFAIQNQATLLHKDPEYDALKGQVEMETLPYK